MNLTTAFLAGCLAGAASMALAGGPYDVLFRTGTLDDVAPGSRILYDQFGAGTGEAAKPLEGLGLRLTVQDAKDSNLDLIDGDRFRRIGTFPTDVGNPLLMYFLETTIRDVAELSGGSPFYLRNRIKESLLEDTLPETVTLDYGGEEIPATRITLYPLAEDANAKRLGSLDDLAISVVVSEEVPGWYHSLSTVTSAGGGYDYRVNIVRDVDAGAGETVQ